MSKQAEESTNDAE